ncbi:atherin-like [Sapajus apella]|uniref:Atherin-like n=1 Tax=Sapajus apella TaxID=9515 RepID=A0A6J3HRA3_SAPAP|nr:atherin-like [Sapajus apella]
MQSGSIPRPSPVPGAPPASEPSTWPQGRRDHPPPIPTAPPCLPSPGPVSSPPLLSPPPLSGQRFGGPDLVLAGNRGLRLNGPALGNRERSELSPARATPASSGSRARAERTGGRASAHSGERSPKAARRGLAARKRGGAMTRERVGAARDPLARLRGGAVGGASPQGHPQAPGLTARAKTHPRPAESQARTLLCDGAAHSTAGFPPWRRAALRICGTPARLP